MPMAHRQRDRSCLRFVIIGLTLPFIGLSACAQVASESTAQSEPEQSVPTSSTTTTIVSSRSSCENDLRGDLQAKIFSQIEALSRGAFEEARKFASPSFRENVGLSEFQSMIQSGFPFLLTGEPAAFGRCRLVDGTATVEVRFGENTPVTLIYFLIWSDNEWWIDAASPAVDSITDKAESS